MTFQKAAVYFATVVLTTAVAIGSLLGYVFTLNITDRYVALTWAFISFTVIVVVVSIVGMINQLRIRTESDAKMKIKETCGKIECPVKLRDVDIGGVFRDAANKSRLLMRIRYNVATINETYVLDVEIGVFFAMSLDAPVGEVLKDAAVVVKP